MNKFLATAAVFAATIAVSANAQATEPGRFPYWYIGLSGGLAFQNDSDVEGTATDIEWDSGYAMSASLGYQPPSFGGFRVEAEVSEHKQDVSNGSGDVTTDVAAANIYYDFFNSSVVTPYVGGGIGYARFDLSNTNPTGTEGNDEGFVYQGLVGIGYEPTTVPNVGLTLGYRYMAAFNDPDTSADYEYDNHSVEIGAKFRF